MDLGGGFNEVLQVSACEEVSEVDEFTVVLILNIDDSPSVLAASNLLATNND